LIGVIHGFEYKVLRKVNFSRKIGLNKEIEFSKFAYNHPTHFQSKNLSKHSLIFECFVDLVGQFRNFQFQLKKDSCAFINLSIFCKK